jgi:hypothetical protein
MRVAGTDCCPDSSANRTDNDAEANAGLGTLIPRPRGAQSKAD